ncbi:MAG TPA: hypothetical protein P5181_03785 [Dermatophilaceae bacterium]|nr:hypothetical protein [Dermatophilaceae bacterium]
MRFHADPDEIDCAATRFTADAGPDRDLAAIARLAEALPDALPGLPGAQIAAPALGRLATLHHGWRAVADTHRDGLSRAARAYRLADRWELPAGSRA